MFIRFNKKRSQDAIHDLPDHDLILYYRKTSDTEIIAELFQRYTHLVYGVSLKYLDDTDDAKDAVMEIFENLMTDLLKHDIHNFKSWLHSVTRNHCLMKLRRKKSISVEMELIKDEDGFMEISQEMHQETGVENISEKQLETALNSLKEPQRNCIQLVYLKGKSYQEVCDITGYSMKEVKSHIQNGKRNLKIKLETAYARKQ